MWEFIAKIDKSSNLTFDIKSLMRGPQAAVTNAPRPNAEFMLDVIGRRHWFDTLIIGNLMTKHLVQGNLLHITIFISDIKVNVR